VSKDLLELRNLVTVSKLIIKSAQQRRESRGLHYTLGFPEKSNFVKDTILVPINFADQKVIITKDK
jgi:L-aspartate oxidase